MTIKDLVIPQKTTKIYEIYFRRAGVGVNITGWTVYFIVKEKMDDPDTSAVIEKDITAHVDPINGKTVIELSTVDTDIDIKNYYYSIDYLDNLGNEGILFTGRLQIAERVRD